MPALAGGPPHCGASRLARAVGRLADLLAHWLVGRLMHCHLASAICYLSSSICLRTVICHLPSAICHLSSVIHHPSSIITSIIRHTLSAINYPSSGIHHLRSAICYCPSSAIRFCHPPCRHLSSVTLHMSSGIHHHESRSAICHLPSSALWLIQSGRCHVT